MTPEQFAYWLQGFFEITDAKEVTPQQVAMIKKHLFMVFDQSLNKKVSQLPQFKDAVYCAPSTPLPPSTVFDYASTRKICSSTSPILPDSKLCSVDAIMEHDNIIKDLQAIMTKNGATISC